MRFDRRASAALMQALAEGGPMRPLVDFVLADRQRLDLQLRRQPKGSVCSASLYAGLTKLLELEERKGLFRLSAHPTHRARGHFADDWAQWQPIDELTNAWPDIESYLVRLLDGRVDAKWIDREGLVAISLASANAATYRLIQREAQISFDSVAEREAIAAPLSTEIHDTIVAADRTEPWWPTVANHGVLPNLGNKADALAVDDSGRLLVIEAKPADALAGITWAPAQCALYARLVARILDEPVSHRPYAEMLDQRVELGLTRPGELPAASFETVVPVVAIGPGLLSSEALPRLAAIAEALDATVGHDAGQPLEVWLIDESGVPLLQWRPSSEPVPVQPAVHRTLPSPKTFSDHARRAAAEWKATTEVLPAEAKVAAGYRGAGSLYDFCLPLGYAEHNLLPAAREIALERFAAAKIPWHHGVGGKPGNHLLSSQVQCANALAPFVDDPDALRTMFGLVLPIEQVVPFGSSQYSRFDVTDHVVFEWIGEVDHLGEWKGGQGSRGANNTSADAAIRYVTPSGATELALIEWKYTEQYHGHELSGGEKSNEVRRARYRSLWDHPDSPVRTDLLPYEDLFVEPFYQLFRLQLMAWRMEQTHELGAEKVRLVYAAPSMNGELWSSLNRPSHRELAEAVGTETGLPVLDIGKAMVKATDRFVHVDTAALVEEDSPTDPDFVDRYRHLRI